MPYDYGGRAGKESVFNVLEYGAVGDGATDDAAKFQAAIDAAAVSGGVVFVPKGTYQINTALSMKSKVKMEGTGFGSTLQCTGGNHLFTFAAATNWWEFKNVRLVATAGHIFSVAFHVTACRIDHCWLLQNSTGFSIWNQTAGNYIELLVQDCDMYVAGATRTVPAWYGIYPNGGCNSNWWINNVCTYGDGCSNQFFFDLQCSAAGDFSYDDHFEENVFETCDGGCIKMLGAWGMVVHGCYGYDNLSMVNSIVYVGKHASGLASRRITIRDSGRIGSNLGGGVQELTFEATTNQIWIENFRCGPDSGHIQLNSATDVYLMGVSSGTTINNGTNAMQLGPNNFAKFPGGLTTRTKAGTPVDGDFTVTPPDGTIVADTTASKIWVRVGGAWKGAALT